MYIVDVQKGSWHVYYQVLAYVDMVSWHKFVISLLCQSGQIYFRILLIATFFPLHDCL